MQKNKEKTSKATANNKPVVQLTQKGLGIWICLCFLVSAWMFALGVFVGRGTAPVNFDIDHLQKELTALKEAVLKQEQAGEYPVSALDTGGPDLEFHEELKAVDDKEVKKDRSPHPVKKRRTGKKKTAAKLSVPEKTVEKKKPVSRRKNAESEKPFTIQVAAFKDSGMADLLVDELKKKGFPAYKAVGKSSSRSIWYRVRVGHFQSKTQAAVMMNRLKKDSKQPMLIKG